MCVWKSQRINKNITWEGWKEDRNRGRNIIIYYIKIKIILWSRSSISCSKVYLLFEVMWLKAVERIHPSSYYTPQKSIRSMYKPRCLWEGSNTIKESWGTHEIRNKKENTYIKYLWWEHHNCDVTRWTREQDAKQMLPVPPPQREPLPSSLAFCVSEVTSSCSQPGGQEGQPDAQSFSPKE